MNTTHRVNRRRAFALLTALLLILGTFIAPIAHTRAATETPEPTESAVVESTDVPPEAEESESATPEAEEPKADPAPELKANEPKPDPAPTRKDEPKPKSDKKAKSEAIAPSVTEEFPESETESSAHGSVSAQNGFDYAPDVTIKKQISTTGNAPWVDADTAGDAVEFQLGDTVYFRLVVQNTGNTVLDSVVLTDDKYQRLVDAACINITSFPMPPTLQLTCKYSALARMGLWQNIATVTGTPPEGTKPTDTDEAWYKVPVGLSIVKDGPANATPGDEITYGIKVTNDGPGPSAKQVFVDTIPAPFVYASATGGDFTCVDNGGDPQMVTCTRNKKLGKDASATVQFKVTVPMSTVDGDYTNCAKVQDNTEDDDTDCATTTVTNVFDLEIKKTGPATAIPGEDFTYGIAVKNLGPDPSKKQVFTDVIPAPLVYESASGDDFSCVSDGSDPPGITCTRDLELAKDATVNVTITVSVPASALAADEIENCATVQDNTEVDDNDTSCVKTPVTPRSVLSILKEGPPTAVAGGPHFRYTVTVKNEGPSDSPAQAFTDKIPAPFEYEGYMTGDGLTCDEVTADSSNLTCTRSDVLVPGATASVMINVSVPASTPAGPYENCAEIEVDDVPDFDRVAGAPFEQTSKSCVTTVVSTESVLSILKEGPPAAVAGGPNFEYTITVTNDGPSDSPAQAFTDKIPAPFEYVSWDSDYFSCTEDAAEVTCSRDEVLVPGDSASATIEVAVPASTPAADYENCAVIKMDDDPAQDGAATQAENGQENGDEMVPAEYCVTTTVTVEPDLSILKEGPATAVAGGPNLEYTIKVTNNGPSDSGNQSFTDQIPSSLEYVGWDSDYFSCTEAAAKVTCSRDEVLTPGESASATIVVKVSVSVSAGDVENCADINVEGQEGTSCATTTVTVPDVPPVVPPTPTQTPAVTGAQFGLTLLGALALLGIGLALVMAARRRESVS